jgi:hypothetical protein
MPEDPTATLTVRLPKSLLDKLDREAQRRSLLAGGEGLISRNGMLKVALEQWFTSLDKPAPRSGKVEKAPTEAKGSAATVRSDPPSQRSKPRPGKTVKDKRAKKKARAPLDSAREPQAQGDQITLNQNEIRQQCKDICSKGSKEQQAKTKASLAKAIGYKTVAGLRNWLNGKSMNDDNLSKAVRWLTEA